MPGGAALRRGGLQNGGSLYGLGGLPGFQGNPMGGLQGSGAAAPGGPTGTYFPIWTVPAFHHDRPNAEVQVHKPPGPSVKHFVSSAVRCLACLCVATCSAEQCRIFATSMDAS